MEINFRQFGQTPCFRGTVDGNLQQLVLQVDFCISTSTIRFSSFSTKRKKPRHAFCKTTPMTSWEITNSIFRECHGFGGKEVRDSNLVIWVNDIIWALPKHWFTVDVVKVTYLVPRMSQHVKVHDIIIHQSKLIKTMDQLLVSPFNTFNNAREPAKMGGSHPLPRLAGYEFKWSPTSSRRCWRLPSPRRQIGVWNAYKIVAWPTRLEEIQVSQFLSSKSNQTHLKTNEINGESVDSDMNDLDRKHFRNPKMPWKM